MRISINFRETIPPSTLLKSGQSPVLIPQELIYSIKDDSRQPLNSYVILPNGQMTQKSYEQKKNLREYLFSVFFFWVPSCYSCVTYGRNTIGTYNLLRGSCVALFRMKHSSSYFAKTEEHR